MNKRELDPQSSAAAEFGAFLRTSREQRGWTQEHLAGLVGCTPSHISALENARRKPTPQISAALDRAFGTSDEGLFRRKASDVTHSALLAGFAEFRAHERRAIELRLFELGIVPGLLQTTDYAAAIAAGAVQRGSITQEQADARVRVLIDRQAIMHRVPPPLVHVVMDESCIRRPVGGDAVMAAQLDRLVAFASQPTARLQLAPYTLGEGRAFDLPVSILTLPNRSLMSYAESSHQGHLERDTNAVYAELTSYHQLQTHAHSQADSVAMIRELRRQL
ncbi:helix-turn-helix transcriptional regulator [Streptomyces sp. MJM8645]|uniref:helix-turn-helix domain-containing protein n=1 Tax=Streptomycetaceae TaxID=2062 RepID=UPI0007AFD1D0|nr:helix-turn-helix transcriptional regulator [Streptomyces sp. MJM8645]